MAILKIWDSTKGIWTTVDATPPNTPNGFSTVKIGDVFIDADSPTDVLNLSGDENVVLLPNEVYDSVVVTVPSIGSLPSLDTTDKTTLVNAINELKSQIISSSTDANYVHNQIAASSSWVINHNLHKYPSVTIVDSAGTVVVGDVATISLDTVEVNFTAEFSGKAYLN